MTEQAPDLIRVERKVFLDLIAAAQMAKAWMAARAPGGDQFALNTRKALTEAIPPAIANDYGSGTSPELLEALQRIASMATGDGLDYCRPLTQNDKMTLRETASQAAVIRGCFLSIEGLAKSAIAKATEQKGQVEAQVIKDNLGRWRVVTDGIADKFNFFATRKEALEFRESETERQKGKVEA